MTGPHFLTREQVRRVDRLAIEQYGMSGLVLMENAGRGVVDALLAADPSLLQRGDATPCPVVILCGKGNNAGDGFVMARHLELRGLGAKVCLLLAADELAGDAEVNLKILRHCDVPMVEIPGEGVAAALGREAAGATWLVDAMLGTGATGEPREPLAAAIRWMNEQPARRLSIDLPSGLNCDSGEAAAATVRADLTCTFVAEKAGFSLAAAKPYLGEVRVVSIGVPWTVVREAASV